MGRRKTAKKGGVLGLFEKWHWGTPATEEIEVTDPDLPSDLVECGRLAELVFDPGVGLKGKLAVRKEPELGGRKLTRLCFGREVRKKCHVAFDPSHPDERLYFYLRDPAARASLKPLWEKNGAAPVKLGKLARMIPGRHSREDYPDIEVKLIGTLYEIVYVTHKEGDAPEGVGVHYFHHMGEETGKRPALAVDQKGRLWLASGDYTCPVPGITN